MEARTLTLNLVPGGVLPRINVSQYDTGVPVVATLYDGDTLYTIPTGAQVYVQGRKHDNTLYQYQCGTSGSIVTFVTTTQMTMVAGENIAEISIHYNGTIVGTINFVIYVEESALQDPTMSSVDDIPVIADLPEIVEEVREDVENAEAWAVGTRQGVPVSDTDETYHNNSKYYAEYAEDVVAQISVDVEKIEQSVIKAATSADIAVFAATSAQSASLVATSAQAAALFYAGEAEESARLAEAWSENPPYIGANGNWWVYDVDTEQFVDSGIDASITMQIADITMLAPEASPYITNSGTSTDAVFHMGIPRGETGSGVASVQKISSEGRVDTYRMTFTDGTHFDYTVTNGADGTGSVSTVNHIDPVGGNVQLKVTDLDVIGTAGQVVGLTSTNTLGVLNIDLSQLENEIDRIAEDYSNVTPTLNSGAKIAEVKTNGTTVDLFAPQGGHVILTSTGSIMPQRSKLKFLNADLTDDAANDTTIVSPRGGGAVIKIGDVEGSSITSTPGTASVVLKWTDPEDIVVSGATLAEWAGTKVVRKVGSAPSNVSDGTVVVDSTTKNAYSSTGLTDSGLTYGTTYYYRFFPYTTQALVTDGSSVNATPDRASVEVPTVGAQLTYDGTEQTQSFTGYDSTKMTVSGNTETDAGSYTAKFNVKADYKWSDGTREEKSVAWSIGKKSVTCPTLSGTYTYTGSSQSVTISSYSASEVTVGGDTSATNAGTYTVTFDLADTDNLIWSDDTSAQKSEDWTIAKAAGSVTLSANSVTLDAGHTSVTVTATGATGTLSVSSSNTSVATVSENSGTITISSVNNASGSATITVNVAASANYLAGSASIAVSASFVAVTWAGGTDTQIANMVAAADRGEIDLTDYWSVGQERTVSLSSMSATGVGESHAAQSVTLVLLDANNTNYEYVSAPASGETTCRFVVGLKNSLIEPGYINSTNTNSGSWKECARRSWCNSTFRNAIPSTLRAIFKQVNVKTIATYNGAQLQTTQDYFTFPAERELVETRRYSMSTEFDALSQFTYYLTTANRHKKLGNNGSDNAYWERSPLNGAATSWCAIDFGDDTTEGTGASGRGASGNLGIAPIGFI